MKITGLIESYLGGELNEQQKKEFETKILEDQKFALEVKLFEETNEAILDNEVQKFRESVKKVINESSTDHPKTIEFTRKFFKYPLVATIFILIVVSFWQLLISVSPEKIYSRFYKPYESDLTTRSANSSTDKINIAYVLYQKKEYEASYEILNNYLSKNSENQRAHFYLGLNSMELGKMDRAISELSEVEKDYTSPFAIHARWYLALAYLETNDIVEARKYLNRIVEEDVFYAEKAKNILKKIKS